MQFHIIFNRTTDVMKSFEELFQQYPCWRPTFSKVDTITPVALLKDDPIISIFQ